MVFNSRVQFWVWKGSDDASEKGHYAIDGDACFNYAINDVRDLIERRYLEKKKEGVFCVNVAINFAHTVFNNSFEIKNCDFCYDFGLYNNCKYNNRVIIEGNVFNKIFDISNSHFNNDNIIQVIISHNKFLSKAKFDEISSHREIIIEKCIFFDEADFSNCVFHKKIIIKDCTFKKGVIYNGTDFVNGFSFINNEVFGYISFEKCVLEGRIKISQTKGEIKGITFSASVIRGLLELNSLKSSIFLSDDSSINLRSIFVEPNGYLIIRNINQNQHNTGKIDFTDANLLGNVVLNNIYLKNFFLTNAAMVGGFFTEHLYFKENSDSQTYVRLKDEALKNNNSIKAMQYREKEMLSYSKELNSQRSCINFSTRLTDKSVLFLNTISNKNGLSWLRGIFFTISCAVLFFLDYKFLWYRKWSISFFCFRFENFQV